MVDSHSKNNFLYANGDFNKNVKHPQTMKHTVLLVEDDPSIRDIVDKALTIKGYKVLHAPNGVEALKMYKGFHNRICTVLMDLNMPGMDGKTCLKEMRKLDSDIKITITSGYLDSDLKYNLSIMGANNFIEKPFHLSDLIECISD